MVTGEGHTPLTESMAVLIKIRKELHLGVRNKHCTVCNKAAGESLSAIKTDINIERFSTF